MMWVRQVDVQGGEMPVRRSKARGIWRRKCIKEGELFKYQQQKGSRRGGRWWYNA